MYVLWPGTNNSMPGLKAIIENEGSDSCANVGANCPFFGLGTSVCWFLYLTRESVAKWVHDKTSKTLQGIAKKLFK